MTRRTCPVPGCGAAVRPGHAMCRECWSLVTKESQRLVQGTWRTFREGTATRPAAKSLTLLNNYNAALTVAIRDVVARR